MALTSNQRLLIALAILLAPAARGQELRFRPFHANGIYDLGERAGWGMIAADDSNPNNGALNLRDNRFRDYKYVIKKNGMETIQRGTLEEGSIQIILNEPAMLYVEITHGMSSPIHLGAAIAPSKLEPAAPRPADFDKFWDEKLRALRKIPINPVLVPTEPHPSGVDLFTVKLDSVGSHVQGYLAKPSKPGKLPALVIYQWAGVYALQPQWATDRAAEGWLTFDVDSHDLPPSQPTGVSSEYNMIGDTSRETSYFLNMYLRDARAIDYITSRPDWDHKTLVIMGTSMGGQQSLVTAGLRSNITAVIVNEPAGADFDAELHGRRPGYPFWPANNPQAMQTGLYFDTVNFASRIKAPVLAGIGFIDSICPPTGIWTAINQIPGPKEVAPMIESDHNNLTPDKQGVYLARAKEVLDTLRHGGKFRPNEELTRPQTK